MTLYVGHCYVGTGKRPNPLRRPMDLVVVAARGGTASVNTVGSECDIGDDGVARDDGDELCLR